jgi:bifunctional UDP-N-acetylglucosamine pyrophosphorylase/glucosamine-1-phosphate N-acetyltransferase
MSEFVAIVLAAGQGTRMKSERAKVLHEIAGRPMVAWSVDTALRAGAREVVAVVGHGREEVTAALAERFDRRVRTAVQSEQRGTGHAVACALPAIEGWDGPVVILYGDCPLIPETAVGALVAATGASTAPLALVTAILDDPTGYGRILRDGGKVTGIREHRDCSEVERAITEVNPGIYAIDAAFLRQSLDRLSADNAQGELYLTDLVGIAAQSGVVESVRWDMADLRGINDRWELAEADGRMRERILRAHAAAGVTLRAPATILVDADVRIAPDAVLEPNVVLRGACTIGAGARIDVGCVLENVTVDAGAWLKPFTVATESSVGPRVHTGPFAHLRPATELGPDVRIGNFVETKKTRMGRGSKANHLAYLGDGVIGEDVNVGAGTIFCNYDGVRKHTTTLEDGSFVGSDCQIVAPRTVGKGAYVATGTTVTRDVPADALAIARVRQTNKEGYASRLLARFAADKRDAKK